MSELGHNTLNTTFTSNQPNQPKKSMHCTNPHCFEDTCKGECQEPEEECCNNDCGCHD